MGMDIVVTQDPEAIRRFTGFILRDLAVLERMIREDRIESGIRRVGVEQELFLVTRGWRPASVAMEVLARLEGEPFGTELGRFNLEANPDPGGPLPGHDQAPGGVGADGRRLAGRVASRHEGPGRRHGADGGPHRRDGPLPEEPLRWKPFV